MKIHKYCKIFPSIDGDEFKQLVLDIKANGLHQKITTLNGFILDGQNRYAACVAAGLPPSFEELPAGIDPLKFVISQNLNRRHLTESQRAMIAAAISESANLRTTQEEAAKTLNVSVRSVQKAVRVRRNSKQDAKAVTDGKIRLDAADKKQHPKPPDPEPSTTDAEIDAATSLPPRETSPRPTPAEAQADAQSEAGERMVAAPEPPPKSLWSAPINTVADALAFCGTCDEEGGQWEAAAMLLASEVDRLNTLLQTTQANMDAVTPDTSQLTPLQLFKELQKNYKPRIPNTLPQPERVKYGIEINKMVIWLMNPVDENGKPLTFSSAYTR